MNTNPFGNASPLRLIFPTVVQKIPYLPSLGLVLKSSFQVVKCPLAAYVLTPGAHVLHPSESSANGVVNSLVSLAVNGIRFKFCAYMYIKLALCYR